MSPARAGSAVTRLLAVVLAVSATGLSPRPATAQSRGSAAGVLVGLRLQKPAPLYGMDSAASYRTLLLVPRGDRFEVATEVAPLIIPRPAGWWRLGVLETCRQEESDHFSGGYSHDRAQYLWAVPLDSVPVVRTRSEDEALGPCRREPVVCRTEPSASIEFVWRNYASLDERIDYTCGVRPERDITFAVRHLDDLDARGVAIGELLGPAAAQAFLTGYAEGKREHLAGRTDGWDCDVREPDDRSWYVVRGGGGWQVQGWSDSHEFCGGFHFPVAVALPPALVGDHGSGRGLPASLEERIPGLQDAYWAPGADLVLAVTGAELSVLALPGQAGSPPLLRVPLGDGEAVVMVEWATGADLERWIPELSGIAGRTFPAPRTVAPGR